MPTRSRPLVAFTLVELLVSMAVLTLLIVMLLGVFNAASSGWLRSEARADAYREARAALALITRDLGQTIIPPVGTPALVLDRHPDDGPVTADDPNEQAHCLTLIPNPGKSALCAVSYFCRWDDQKKTWSLVRRVVNSDNLFFRFGKAKSATPDQQFGILFARTRDTDNPKDTSTDYDRNDDRDDIASFVWDLQFRVPIGDNLTHGAGSAQPDPAVDSGKFYQVAPGNPAPPFPGRLPPYVEVRFKALSAAAAARLRGSAKQKSWIDPGDPLYRSVILPGSQQFVQRVPLANVPPPP